MTLFCVRVNHGIGIRAAKTEASAFREACREVGEYNVQSVTEATEQEINYVRSMGGYVPRLANESEKVTPWADHNRGLPTTRIIVLRTDLNDGTLKQKD